LDQRVRVVHHQRQVLAGARLALVGVDDEVVRLPVVLRNEAPLETRREPRAAASAQPRVLDELNQVVRVHGERLAQGEVAVELLIDLKPPRVRRQPALRQDGGELLQDFASRLGHLSASFSERPRDPAFFPAAESLAGLFATAWVAEAFPPIGVFGSKPATVTPYCCANRSPRSDGSPGPPSATAPSRVSAKPASCSEISLNVHNRAPRVGFGRRPAR